MKRKYYRKCGDCGEKHEQSEMIRTNFSDNGTLVKSAENTILIKIWKGIGRDMQRRNIGCQRLKERNDDSNSI